MQSSHHTLVDGIAGCGSFGPFFCSSSCQFLFCTISSSSSSSSRRRRRRRSSSSSNVVAVVVLSSSSTR